jgi:membrane associated rhomboid family serine protease
MIPFRGGNGARVRPVAVYAIVAANVLVFVREVTLTGQEARDRFVDGFALVPYDLTHGVTLASPAPPALATLITAQFLHASVLHLFFNMLFFFVFGPEIEWLCGHVRFVAFYLACGVLGGLAQVSVAPGSHIPGIGASGAIAGVLGAYVVRFPTNRVETIVPIGCFPLLLRVPAVLVIGLWAAIQFVHGFAPVAPGALSERGGGIAYFAHIGGFLAGIFLVGVFTKRRRKRQGPRLRSADY